MSGTACRLYHAGIVLYFLWLDQHILSVGIEILTTREDIVNAHWVGLGLQFFTVWSQIAQQIFSFSILAEDVIEVVGLEVKKEKKNKLHKLNNDLFTCVVIPVALIVSVNFWIMYSFLENNLIEDLEVITRHVPNWMNYCLHTVIVLLPLVEMVMSHKPHPDRRKGLLVISAVLAVYVFWVIFARVVGGRWSYPFLSLLSLVQKLYYLSANFLLAMASYLLGEFINKALWGKHGGRIGERKKMR